MEVPVRRLVSEIVPWKIYGEIDSTTFNRSMDDLIAHFNLIKEKIIHVGYTNPRISARYNSFDFDFKIYADRMQTLEEHQQELIEYGKWKMKQSMAQEKKVAREVKQLERLIRKHGIPAGVDNGSQDTAG